MDSTLLAAPPLKLCDFALGGLPLDADSASVLAILGHPDSVRLEPQEWATDVEFVLWYFPGAIISLMAPNMVAEVAATSPEMATPRGLRVGDDSARVRQLYGEPLVPMWDSWMYVNDPERPEHFVIFEFEGGKVTSIIMHHFRG